MRGGIVALAAEEGAAAEEGVAVEEGAAADEVVLGERQTSQNASHTKSAAANETRPLYAMVGANMVTASTRPGWSVSLAATKTLVQGIDHRAHQVDSVGSGRSLGHRGHRREHLTMTPRGF